MDICNALGCPVFVLVSHDSQFFQTTCLIHPGKSTVFGVYYLTLEA